MYEQDLEAKVDQPIVISGAAQNAKLGAIVMTGDYIPIYMDAIAEWESGIRGETIEVTGTLRHRNLAPNPTVNTDGEISHGLDGDSYILENPTWRLLDK